MKLPSLSVGSPRAIMLRQAFMLLFLFIPFLCSIQGLSPYWMVCSVLLGCYGYIPFFLLCQAMVLAPIGIVTAIGNSFPLVVCILSYFLWGVPLTPFNWLGVILTTSGVFVLSLFRPLKSKHQTPLDNIIYRRANLLALGACLLWGVFFTLVQLPNEKLGFIPFVFCAQLGTFISASLHSYYTKNLRNISVKTLKIGVKAGILALVGSLCFYKALSLGNPSIVTGIAGCSPIVGAIFGIYAYKENLRIPQWIGVALSILGVCLLK